MSAAPSPDAGPTPDSEPSRHIRQERLPQIGAAGQDRLARARVAIVGVGATGSRLAELLGRAGVGTLRLIDRDVVERTNLARQAFYTDADARAVRPKAEAAAAALTAIDPGLDVAAHVTDLTPDNADRLLRDVDVVLDGTDNFGTRMLVNDWCVRERVPFLYTGVVGTEGQMLMVRPGGPCLRCYVPELPAPGVLPTCETAGVLGSAVAVLAGLAATETLRLLVGDIEDRPGEVSVLDAWSGTLRRVSLSPEPACPCCAGASYAFLDDAPAAMATELCGRDAVQLPAPGGSVDLAAVAADWRREGSVTLGPSLLRLDLPAQGGAGARRILLFRDGRMIVGGTRDAAEARTMRARLLGA
ncbi:MAG: ThiF family adenylyltransferase [Planctomycetota bacterium]|jgi:adenylyltransferase/sulfurtransferase